MMKNVRRKVIYAAVAIVISAMSCSASVRADPVVPGSGVTVEVVGNVPTPTKDWKSGADVVRIVDKTYGVVCYAYIASSISCVKIK